MERLCLQVWSSPAGAGLVSLAAYLLLALVFGYSRLDQGSNPYYVYLADGFLHGQLSLRVVPQSVEDLILYQGHYYLYWPPFPALPFAPLVAIFGSGASDALLHLALAGLNVALVSLLLAALTERGLVDLSPAKRAWLTAFFAFGTVHVTLAPYAHAYYTAQLIAFALLCGAYVAALRLSTPWAPLAAGVLVACAFLSRSGTLAAGGWIAWYLLRQRGLPDRPAAVRTAVAGLAPVVVAAVALAAYNYARFGSPLDFGLLYKQWNPMLRPDFEVHGAFSLHYLPANLFYTFVYIPYLAPFGGDPKIGFWMGGSLFLMSPVFFLALSGMSRSWRWQGLALMVSSLAGLVPALLWVSTGWVQFGPRFTLDITVPLIVATALGAQVASTRLISRLSLISFAVYLPGAILLGLVKGM